MSRRLGLLLVVVVTVAGGAWLWLGSGSKTAEGPPSAIERADEPAEAPPTLIGTAEERPGTQEAPTAKPAPPSRPWETRAGFDVGAEGESRAFGRVVFGDGRPAPGAYVWKTYVYRPFFRSLATKGHHDFFSAATKTDAEGRYRFTSRQIRSKLAAAALLARHDDQAALLLEIEDDGKRAEIPDLVLGPAIETRVEVVTSHGDPVPGASGTLKVHFGSKGIPSLLLGDVSDAQGQMTFLPLPDRADLLLELELVHPRYPDVERDLDVDALRRGEVPSIEVPLGRTVRGCIVTADGEPARDAMLLVAGYDAYWKRQQMLEGYRSRVDARGEFEVHGVPAPDARLLVYRLPKEDRKRWSRYLSGEVFPTLVVEVASGRHGDLLDLGRIHLEPLGTIHGRVQDSAGEPVEGAQFDAALPIGGVPGGGRASTKTDAEGRFRLDGLPVTSYDVRVHRTFPRLGRRDVSLQGVRPGGPPLDVRLTGGSTLVLRLHPDWRPEEDLPVRGFSIHVLRPPGTEADLESSGAWAGGSSRAGQSLWRLRFEPGTHEIEFTANGYREVRVGPFEITADAETVIDLELTPE